MKLSILLLVSVAAITPLNLHAQEVPPFPAPPKDFSATTMVAPAGEPGERLVITGTAYKADGKTPFASIVLYVYQTDASGVYNKTDGSWQRPRLRGWVKTDRNGKYKINTIKPGSYPNSKNPAHIHAIAQLPGEQPKWIDDFLFDGDPYLSERDRKQSADLGRFSHIMKTWREPDGLLRAERDIVLK